MSPYNLKKGAIMPMKIEKRKNIDDSIYEELARKHPVKSEKGVCYVQSMDYITLEVNDYKPCIFGYINPVLYNIGVSISDISCYGYS